MQDSDEGDFSSDEGEAGNTAYDSEDEILFSDDGDSLTKYSIQLLLTGSNTLSRPHSVKGKQKASNLKRAAEKEKQAQKDSLPSNLDTEVWKQLEFHS